MTMKLEWSWAQIREKEKELLMTMKLEKNQMQKQRNNTKDIKVHKLDNISSQKIIGIEITIGDNDESSQWDYATSFASHYLSFMMISWWRCLTRP